MSKVLVKVAGLNGFLELVQASKSYTKAQRTQMMQALLIFFFYFSCAALFYALAFFFTSCFFFFLKLPQTRDTTQGYYKYLVCLQQIFCSNLQWRSGTLKGFKSQNLQQKSCISFFSIQSKYMERLFWIREARGIDSEIQTTHKILGQEQIYSQHKFDHDNRVFCKSHSFQSCR